MNPNVKATASYIPGTTAWTMAIFEAADVPEGTKVQPVQQPAVYWKGEKILTTERLIEIVVAESSVAFDAGAASVQVEDAINAVLKHHKIVDGVLRADLIAAVKKGSIE